MTGRRSTRAGSKEPTPAPQRTPRRSGRRAGGSVVESSVGSAVGTPLPAVTSKESTSYGSSVSVLPYQLNRTVDDVDLASTLADIMEPVNESVAARTRGTSGTGPNPSFLQATMPPSAIQPVPMRDDAMKTPARGRGKGSSRGTSVPSTLAGPDTSKSFQNESGVFDFATFNNPSSAPETPIRESPDPVLRQRRLNPTPQINTILEELEENEPDESLRPESTEQRWEELFRSARARRREAEDQADRSWYAPIVNSWNADFNVFSTLFQSMVALFHSIFIEFPLGTARWVKKYPAVMVILAICALLGPAIKLPVFADLSVSYGSSRSTGHYIHSYGSDISHGIAQFIPHALVHPLNYFNDGDLLDLQKRMKTAENDISWLKKRASLGKESIEHLESLIPNFVVFKKNKLGERVIPTEFWLALKDKITQEPFYFQGRTSDNKESKMTAESGDLSVVQVKRIAADAWSEFLERNEARIKTWQAEEFDGLWSKHLKDSFQNDVLIHKSELIQMLRQSWDDSKALIAAEVAKISKQIESGLLEASQQSTKTVQKLISKTQIKALADAKLQQNVNHALLRVNHFSLGTGAVVNPKFTSPTYPQPHHRASILKRGMLAMLGNPLRKPNPPIEALKKWDEQGDCWCSPSNREGEGAQLAVMTSHLIYPDQVVIEHIPTEATLDHHSFPKDMELWAKIEDWDSQAVVGEMSDRLFPGERPGSDSGLDSTWERIGKWTYKKNANYHIQAFTPQLDLKSFKVPTRNLAVRVKNNWGGIDHSCLYRVRVHGDVAA